MSILRRRVMATESGIGLNTYFTIQALDTGNIGLKFISGGSAKTIQYRVNGGQWTDLTSTSSGQSFSVSRGDEVEFKSTNTSLAYNSFTATCDIIIYGNVMSLLNGDNFATATTFSTNLVFRSLFSDNTSLIDASGLLFPATTLTKACYQQFFSGCTSLTKVPEILPATTLAQSCYNSMFNGCSMIERAPVLPAETLTTGCYNQMFKNCSRLSYIKALFTSTPNTDYNTYRWVEGVASSGIFVKNSAATWDLTDRNGIPSGWTVQTASS